ncbi:sensor histidine kinase [Hwangdonia seohaensis]|uniref:Sensor histidine kinase n=1 Tax=Hwangdonia seohaensis TaxID=1240727 RepID=A0ABW3R8A7_9FLAO|nr:histidine kinase [Hwangdonia seohaensis]
MKRIIALILIFVVTQLIIQSNNRLSLSNRVAIENYKNPKDDNWEYIKYRLFDGKTESVYKINPLMDDGPILLELNRATKLDSIAVQEIMEDLRALLPLKTIEYLDDYAGEKISNTSKYKNDWEKKIKDIPYHRLRYSVVPLSFEIADRSTFGAKIKTVLSDGSSIERSNKIKEEGFKREPNSVWFFFKDSISYEKRKQYIQYEFLRTLCFIHPNDLNSYADIANKGVYFSQDYVPQYAKFNEQDKFLLQKLYSENFNEQFKEYMYANYPWRYASNFLNKKLTKAKALIIIVGVGILVFILLFGYFQNKKFKYSFLNYFYPILFIMLNLAYFIQIYGYIIDINSTITWIESLYMIVGATVFTVIISLSLWLFDNLIKKQNLNFTLQLVLKVIFTFVAFNIPMLAVGKGIIQNFQFQESYAPILFIWIALAFGRGLLIYLNHMAQSLVNEKDVELSRLKEANTQSELKLLQSHINPHFLYNALNSIAGLAYKSPEKTEKMALSLSNLFRYSINKKGQQMSTVKEEVLMVQNYLEIEKIRFGERLTFILEVEKTLENEAIPMYILQPLVENAIKHGVSQIRGEGLIVLEIKQEDDNLLIRVIDNGPDFENGLVSGHGLQTVYDLLRLSYGDKASLHWENAPAKHISIIIPKN